MEERIILLKKQFDFEVGEMGTIVPYKPQKSNEAKDDIHNKGWTHIKMDKGGAIDGSYTKGVDYQVIPDCPRCKDMLLYLCSKNLLVDFIQSLGDKPLSKLKEE